MQGAGEELLSCSGLAPKEDRGVAARRDPYLLQHRTDRRAISHDAADSGLYVGRRLALDRLLEAIAVLHDPFAIASDEALQSDCLANEVRDHREKPRVFVERSRALRAYVAVDGERADDLPSFHDGDAYECDGSSRRTFAREVPPLEQRLLSHVRDDERHLGDHNLSDRALREALEVPLRGSLTPAAPDDDFGVTALAEERDQAVTHVEKARKQVEHFAERHFEAAWLAQHL